MKESDARRDYKRKQSCRIITAYEAAYPDPLVMKAGDELTTGEKTGPWKGWVWCTNEHGQSRWIPENYVAKKGGECTMRCDFG